MRISQAAAKKALDKKRAPQVVKFDIKDFLFEQQYNFVMDEERNKLAVCSRRSGKTLACAADLINTALETPDVVCLYITLSRNNAKKIIWREIGKINKSFKLGGEENLSELSISFPNGSIIYLSGAKDKSEIEKFRGLAIKKVYIDEAQSFRDHIEELIKDVLAPALIDYAGSLIMIGTPGPVPVGFFHDCAEKVSGWSKHHWTFWDNPYIVQKSKKKHADLLQSELKMRGVTASDPSIQREWFGKWVLDSDSLLIHYDKIANDYDKLPDINAKDFTYILGIDLGLEDADALAVLAWSEKSPNIYLVEEQTNRNEDITSLMRRIEGLRQKYDISKIVADTGGLGKKITEELIRRHQIPIQPADKARKMENVRLLNDFLRTGRFKAKSSSKFAEDSYLVEIDREKSRPDRIVVSDRYHSDIIDAVLYAFKESPAYTFEPTKEKAKWGTKEWAAEQQDEMFDQAFEHFTKLHEDGGEGSY